MTLFGSKNTIPKIPKWSKQCKNEHLRKAKIHYRIQKSDKKWHFPKMAKNPRKPPFNHFTSLLCHIPMKFSIRRWHNIVVEITNHPYTAKKWLKGTHLNMTSRNPAHIPPQELISVRTTRKMTSWVIWGYPLRGGGSEWHHGVIWTYPPGGSYLRLEYTGRGSNMTLKCSKCHSGHEKCYFESFWM